VVTTLFPDRLARMTAYINETVKDGSLVRRSCLTKGVA
jgi:hypothetical protein